MCSKVIFVSLLRRTTKWARRNGGRGSTDEGERECQELTSECVLKTPSRSLVHNHCSFKHARDRHVHRRSWNCCPSYSVVRPKNRLCRTIWLAFVCAHARSYFYMRHENVSGSFETPSCCRNVRTRHELACVRKVVTRSLPRFLLVHVTCRHMRTKRHAVIWTCARTQETKRDLRSKALFWTRIELKSFNSHL